MNRFPIGRLRARIGGGRLKIQHGIIDNLRGVLERMLVQDEDGAIKVIIPGSIKPIPSLGHGKNIQMRVTIPIANGFKAIAVGAGARQEVFINTTLSSEELERLISNSGAFYKV